MRKFNLWSRLRKNRLRREKTPGKKRGRRLASSIALGAEFLEPRWVLAGGTLDPAFDFDGIVVQDLLAGKDEQVHAVTVQSNGQILVAGQIKNLGGSQDDFLIARFNVDGSLDTTFGTSPGYTIVNVSGGIIEDFGREILIDGSGRILVAGTARDTTVGINQNGFAVVRLLATGAIDTSFGGGDGSVIKAVQVSGVYRDVRGESIALDSDDNIVVGGWIDIVGQGHNFAVARFDQFGVADTSFDTDGVAYVDFAALADDCFDIAVQSDDKIVAVGSVRLAGSNFDFGVARFNTNGSLDTTFDVDGKQTTAFGVSSPLIIRDDRAASVVLDGTNIVVAGSSLLSLVSTGANQNRQMAVARYTSSGALDTTFNTGSSGPDATQDGTLLIRFPTPNTYAAASSIVMQPDGKYVVSGVATLDLTAANQTNFALSRVLPNGTRDTGFGTSGFVITTVPSGGTSTFENGLAMTPDNRIVAAGYSTISGSQQMVLMRYESGLVTADAGGPYSLNEPGGTVTLSGSGGGPLATYLWDLDGDSIFGETGVLALRGDEDGQEVDFSVSGADGPDDTYIVTLQLTDGSVTVTDTATVQILNVAPTLTISGASSVNEGDVYTLNLSSSDPGDDTITGWTIDWGDGNIINYGAVSSVTHTYDDGDDNHTISAEATDEDGTFLAGNTVAVAVLNVAPTLTISGASSVNEGDVYTLNLSSSDPGDDTITGWTIDWGDGNIINYGAVSSVTHTYDDGDDNHTISAEATDEDGTFLAGNTVAVAVLNVAPTLTISGASSVNEGDVYTLNLSSSDPGDDTITSWTIDWGDTVETILGNPSSVTHTYDDGDFNYIITAEATDDDGTFLAGNTVAVAVLNVAPTLTISGASSVNEGDVYTLNLSSSDPGDDTITGWTIDWGDTVETILGNPSSVTHTYDDGANPSTAYSISATATDEDGTFASNTVAVSVNNVAPTANAGGPYFTFEDTPITLSGSGSDPAGALIR